MSNKSFNMNRRGFLQSTAITAGALAISPLYTACTSSAKTETGRSVFGGVEIGAITYSFRSMPTDAGSILLYSLSAGLGSLEMMGDVAENYAGKPQASPGILGVEDLTEQDLRKEFLQLSGQLQDSVNVPEPDKLTVDDLRREIRRISRILYNGKVSAWRLTVPMTKYEELARIYKMAGVNIRIIKLSPNAGMSDEELDYVFNVCKAVGAIGVSTEVNLETVKRVAPFAAKHGKFLILHNHDQFKDESFSFDPFLEYENVRLNFDMGIYYGSTGKNPIDIVEKYHESIVSIHIKDYNGPDGTPPSTNQIWGQGQTPLKEFLLYIQSNAGKQGWPVNCDIELSYDIPSGSDALAEVKRSLEFVKSILVK